MVADMKPSSRGLVLLAVSSQAFSQCDLKVSRSLGRKSEAVRTLLTRRSTSPSDFELLPVFIQFITFQIDIFANGQGGAWLVTSECGERGGGGGGGTGIERFERSRGSTEESGSYDGRKRY